MLIPPAAQARQLHVLERSTKPIKIAQTKKALLRRRALSPLNASEQIDSF